MKYIIIAILLISLFVFVSGCIKDIPYEQPIRVESTSTSRQVETLAEPIIFRNLEEVWTSKTPLGNRVEIHGIGIKMGGVSIKDLFLFTDDERVMKNPKYLSLYGAEYDIRVYNTPKADFRQNLVNINGTIIPCKRETDGKICIDADKIEVVSPLISA